MKANTEVKNSNNKLILTTGHHCGGVGKTRFNVYKDLRLITRNKLIQSVNIKVVNNNNDNKKKSENNYNIRYLLIGGL